MCHDCRSLVRRYEQRGQPSSLLLFARCARTGPTRGRLPATPTRVALFMRYLVLTVVLVVCCGVLPAAPIGAVAASRHLAAPPQAVVIDPGHGGSESGAADVSGQLL